MTIPTPKDRALMFRRGFGDGAKSGAIRHPDDDDYMAGRRIVPSRQPGNWHV